MIKFTHVEGFHNVVRTHRQMGAHPTITRYRLTSPVTFRGTVKLHGSNVGVVCTPEGLQAQSRNRDLSVEDDNYGFAAFVARPEVGAAVRELEGELRRAADVDAETPLVLWGEWIGPGVQRGVATAGLPSRQWALFAVGLRRESDVQGDEDADKQYLDVLPALGDRFADQGIFSVLDVKTWELTVDFAADDTLGTQIEAVDGWVSAVEAQCPWGARFGVEGIGEGIVFTPVGEHQGKTWLFWKAKGEKHKKTKTKQKVAVDPEILASIDEFVDFSVTEGRLEQGVEHLAEMGLEVSMKSTGPFLQWVAQDVKRECRAELEAAGLEWKQVAKAVNQRSLDFFKQKVQAL